jgi:hypothetical protein
MLKKTLLITLVSLLSASAATFYLLPSPSAFTIYNEYEQSLSPEELARFTPYTPLQLVAPDVALSDGISRAAKFRFGGKTVFLLRGDNGRLAGEGRSNEPQIIADGEAIGDTIEVLRSGAITVSPIAGQAQTVAQGKLLMRVFRSGGRCYVSLPDASLFGWSSLEPKSAWRRAGSAVVAVQETTPADTAMPPALRERIRAKIDDVNDTYRRLFSHFDALTGAGKSVPQWRYDCSGVQCRCTLAPPYDKSDELSESTRELRREIENMLSGSGFMVTGGRGEIVIARTKADGGSGPYSR